MKKYIALIIWLSIVVGCRKEIVVGCREEERKEAERKGVAKIDFVDSTYVHERKEYKVGEKIYLLVSEPTTTGIDLPDTVQILITTVSRDQEVILASWPPNVVVITLIHPYGGWIVSRKNTVIHGNDTLEISSNDKIVAYYHSVTEDVLIADTALIKIPKGVKNE